MSAHTERAWLMLQRSKPDMAERELRHGLADDPNDPHAFSFLALALAQQDRLPEALAAAERAIPLAPDDPFVHYVLALVHFDRHKYTDAMAAIDQAIAFNPEHATYHALKAGIHIQRRRWQDALESAERALRFDPQDVQANNWRSIALTNMGQRDLAGLSIQQTLRHDPNDAVAHANEGWRLLHDNNPRQAAEHFREALRLQPDLEWARAGVAEAMKARNPLYRLMLQYFLMMGRLPDKTQWFLIIGLFVFVQFIDRIQASLGSLAWVATVILFAYGAFVVLAWCAMPLFNLILLADRFGRHTLSDHQRRGAMIFGIGLALLVPMVAAAVYVLGLDVITYAFFLPVLPLSGAASMSGQNRMIFVGITAALLAVGLYALVMLFTKPLDMPKHPAVDAIVIVAWGSALSTWLGGALASRSRG